MNSTCIRVTLVRALGRKTDQRHELETRQRACIDPSSDEFVTIDSDHEPRGGIGIHNELGHWMLTVQKGAVPVTVNGRQIWPEGSCKLAKGDVLEVGVCRFEIDMASPDEDGAIPAPDMRDNANPFDIIPAADIHHGRPAAQEEAGEDKHDALAVLAREYRLALIDPHRMQHVGRIDSLSVGIAFVPSATPEDIARAHSHRTLQEIVAGPKSIDSLIGRLDDLDAIHLLEPPRATEVLRLFAPPHLHRQPGSVPPAITRRDHQSVGIDSHYRMPTSPETTPP